MPLSLSAESPLCPPFSFLLRLFVFSVSLCLITEYLSVSVSVSLEVSVSLCARGSPSPCLRVFESLSVHYLSSFPNVSVSPHVSDISVCLCVSGLPLMPVSPFTSHFSPISVSLSQRISAYLCVSVSLWVSGLSLPPCPLRSPPSPSPSLPPRSLARALSLSILGPGVAMGTRWEPGMARAWARAGSSGEEQRPEQRQQQAASGRGSGSGSGGSVGGGGSSSAIPSEPCS